MRIEYESTLDEIADEHCRAAARSRLLRRMRWQSAFWSALFGGVILFMYLTLDGATVPDRFIFTALGVVGGAGGYWLSYHRRMKRRVLRYLRERMQSDGPFHFIVELREDCIWTKQGGTQLSFDWGNLADVVDAGDSVEFHMHDGGFVIVRNKGFPTDESRNEFLKAANQRLNIQRKKQNMP
jgi:hypothetical protein